MVNTVVMPAATNAFLLSNATWDGRRSRSRSISFSFVSFLKKIEEGSVFPFLGKGREKKFFLPIKTRMRESLARPFIVAHAERA